MAETLTNVIDGYFFQLHLVDGV